MYPDTDSAPIPLTNSYIEDLRKNIPSDIIDRIHQLQSWNIPEDTFTYIFSRNYFPLIVKLITELKVNPVYAGTFIGHTFKFIEGHYKSADVFNINQIYDLFQFLEQHQISYELAEYMLPVLYEHPKMDFESVLISIQFTKISEEQIISMIPFLKNKYQEIAINPSELNSKNWIMGELRRKAVGNISLGKLSGYLTN
jgi:glutamyl-tRNA(Gln) amidotransferase subunit E